MIGSALAHAEDATLCLEARSEQSLSTEQSERIVDCYDRDGCISNLHFVSVRSQYSQTRRIE